MKLKFKCGCGGYNYTLEDWCCHFKYRGFKRGLWNLIKTRIEVFK